MMGLIDYPSAPYLINRWENTFGLTADPKYIYTSVPNSCFNTDLPTVPVFSFSKSFSPLP
jgi:hypothetical protein